MNRIALILSSGSGIRFGTKVPKQYNCINGKEILAYVIEAAKKSKCIDKIVVVANDNYVVDIKERYNVLTVQGGKQRNISLQNGLNYCEELGCEKLVICDAVRPFITSAIIDDYINSLDKYDAVVTAQKITDSIGNINFEVLNRDNYYLMQSPEAFRFDLLYKNFDKDSIITEVTQQLPKNAKIYLNFNFSNNLKITYPYDLKYAEILERELYVSQYINRLQDFIQTNYSQEAEDWATHLLDTINILTGKWNLQNIRFIANPHFGVIVLTNYKKNDVILKIIPPFINRYEKEKLCYKTLSNDFMCHLIDYDDSVCAILIDYIDSDTNIDYENKSTKELVKNFFKLVYKKKIKATSEMHDLYNDYQRILINKMGQIYDETYKKELVKKHVEKAIMNYKLVFENTEKYLLHGDLHRYNLLLKDNKIIAIDPIGYISPIEFEFARFIGTEITETLKNVKQQDYVETLKSNINKINELIKDFSEIQNDENKLRTALYIDIVFRMHNSLFEDSDRTLTEKWLTILDQLF